MMNGDKLLVMRGRLLDGMYRVKAKSITEMVFFSKVVDIGTEWHRKLGHPGYGNMKFLMKSEGNFGLPREKCKICVMGKQTRVSYKAQGERCSELLELIHTDVNGPMPAESIGGYRYFMSFIDDYSTKVFLYSIKLKSDNRTEFVNKQMEKLFTKSGIIHQKSIPYTPQSRGIIAQSWKE